MLPKQKSVSTQPVRGGPTEKKALLSSCGVSGRRSLLPALRNRHRPITHADHALRAAGETEPTKDEGKGLMATVVEKLGLVDGSHT